MALALVKEDGTGAAGEQSQIARGSRETARPLRARPINRCGSSSGSYHSDKPYLLIIAMKCPNCGATLWFVKNVCPFCKTNIPPENEGAPTAIRPPIAGAAREDEPESLVTLTNCETLAEADALRA